MSKLLLCEELPERENSDEIFRVTDEYLRENGLKWKGCINVCTDGASLMTGNLKDFFTGRVLEHCKELEGKHFENSRLLISAVLKINLKNGLKTYFPELVWLLWLPWLGQMLVTMAIAFWDG
jgi:hypothetical protein